MTNPRLLGVVLAGGKSSRMGRDKATLQVDTQSYLQHATERIAKVCDDVAVSGPGTLSTLTDAHIIVDPLKFRGPAVGVAAALLFAQQKSFDACLFTPIDMPDLSVANLSMIKGKWQECDRLTVAFCQTVQPLIGIYPVNLTQQIGTLADSPNRSLSRWVQQQDFISVELPASSCRNINTPEDLNNGS